LPEQVILVSQSLDLGRKTVEPPPKFAPNPRIHSAGFGKGRLLPSLYSLVAASMSRSSFPPGSASFFICRSQSSSSIGFSKAASSQRSSGLSCSIAALISSTRLIAPSVSVNGISGNSRVIRDVTPSLNSVKERGRVKQIYAALRSQLSTRSPAFSLISATSALSVGRWALSVCFSAAVPSSFFLSFPFSAIFRASCQPQKTATDNTEAHFVTPTRSKIRSHSER